MLNMKWHEFKYPTDNVMTNTTLDSLALKGNPLIIMKQMGAPASDAVAPPSNNVSLGSSRIAYLSQRKYYFKMLNQSQRTVLDVPAANAFPVLVSENYMSAPLAAGVTAAADV